MTETDNVLPWSWKSSCFANIVTKSADLIFAVHYATLIWSHEMNDDLRNSLGSPAEANINLSLDAGTRWEENCKDGSWFVGLFNYTALSV